MNWSGDYRSISKGWAPQSILQNEKNHRSGHHAKSNLPRQMLVKVIDKDGIREIEYDDSKAVQSA